MNYQNVFSSSAPVELEVRFDKRSVEEVIKEEMLKKYQYNIYLLSKIFSNMPIKKSEKATENEDSMEDDFSSSDSSDDEDEISDAQFQENLWNQIKIEENLPTNKISHSDLTNTEISQEEKNKKEQFDSIIKEMFQDSGYEKKKAELEKEKKKLGYIYKSTLKELEKLDEVQKNTLENFMKENHIFNEMMQNIKQTKHLPKEIDSFIRISKDLNIYPYNHPKLAIFQRKGKTHRPFTEREKIEFMKI